MYYKKFLIMLDNGHGSDTKGKRSPDESLLEYKYAREIVRRIDETLSAMGIDTFIVTPEENDVSLVERNLRINKKYYECKQKDIPSVVISVHVNAAGNGEWKTATGWGAYTSKGDTKADRLSYAMYQAAHNSMDPIGKKIREDWSDGDPDIEQNFYILKKTLCPAVLTENFFMDNKDDVKYLLSEEGMNDIVNIHVEGILNYIDNEI